MNAEDERLHRVLSAEDRSLSPQALHQLGAAARDALKQQPRARSWWRDALGILILNLAMGLGAAFVMSWSMTQHASVTSRMLVAAGWLSVAAVGSVVWLRPGPAWQRWSVTGLFGLVSVLAIVGASGFDPGVAFSRGVGCALSECAVALVPAVAMFVLSLRFSATATHVFVGALASASGGILALHFHCANGTVAHVVVFHLLPAVILASLAALLRTRMRPRTFVP